MPADSVDDSELVAAALRGESEAFASLVRGYQDRLLHAMYHLCGSTEEAEDVVQETFVQAYLKLDTFEGNSRFYTWVYRIAVNFALSRRRRRRPQHSLDLARETGGVEPICEGESPEHPLVRREAVEAVRAGIALLSEDHRAIIVLRDLHDLSYEEIAESLEINLGTVRSRLSRARCQLKELLQKSPSWSDGA